MDPVLQTILFPRRLAVAVTEPWGTKQERRDVPKFTATHVEQTVARIITKPMPACKHKATQSLGKVLEMQGADEGGLTDGFSGTLRVVLCTWHVHRHPKTHLDRYTIWLRVVEKTSKPNQNTDEAREPYFPVDIERLPLVKVMFSTAAPPFVFRNPLVDIKASNLKPCFSCQSRQPPTTREKFDNLPRFRSFLQGQP